MTHEDGIRALYHLQLARNDSAGKGQPWGKGGGKSPGKGLTKDKGKGDVQPSAPAAPAYKICTYFPKGTCHFGENCQSVHQNPDGRTVKTAAPARARSAAGTASIRATRAARRTASHGAGDQ